MKVASLLAVAFLGMHMCTARADTYYLVKITDRANNVSLSVMSAEDLRALQADIQAEAKLHPKALQMARKAWEADEENTKSFPKDAIHRREATPGPAFADVSEANDKRMRTMDRTAAEDRQEARMKRKQLVKRYEKVTRDKKVAEMAARERERKRFEDSARTLYEAQLAHLKSGITAPAPGP
ncbi:MAG: hypothetical protein O3B24_01365 [Verrucomicrobia bacterium]|nr:hypothetical protein [Verrucomicrobiota bacterium]